MHVLYFIQIHFTYKLALGGELGTIEVRACRKIGAQANVGLP